MSTPQIRELLHDYIKNADDRTISLIYDMVQANMSADDYELDARQRQVLDERIAAHQANPSSGSSWDEVKARIKDQL